MPSPPRFLLLSFFAGLFLFAVPSSQAHPAHAEDVSHPFVAGFERFFAEGDAPDYLRQGGELLLSELNCVACHAVPNELEAHFPGSPGTNLRGVAARVQDPAALQILVRNPRYLKRGTRMPSLFAAADRDLDELDALFHFLLSLDEAEEEPLLIGLPERGQEIYHTIGCIACHAPDVEYRPAALPEDAVLDNPAMPSLPIRLAVYWSTNYLTRYLMDPGKFQPAHRMPNFGLSEQEAADLAAYLQAGPELTDPNASLPEPDPRLVEQGRALFQAKNCVACHDLGLDQPDRRLPGLLELSTEDRGCLAEFPQEGAVPYYYLGNTQRTAIKLALEGLQQGTEFQPDPVHQTLMRWDCYSCHTFDGRGGPELAREPFFGAFDPRALDRETFLPPALETVGQRRSAEELDAVFTGEAPRRHPEVGSRMVRIAPDHRQLLIDLLLGQSR